MISLAADENFNNDILRGLLRRHPHYDVVRVQDVGLTGAPDPEILDWAARENRVLLTHDLATMPDFAYRRIEAGKSTPGIIAVHRKTPFRQVIEDLILVVEYSSPEEWANQVRYLPL